MRVALIDNMNNNFFSFSRYLRDLGIDANLYKMIGNNNSHFAPSSDTFKNVSELNWIHSFPSLGNYFGWLFCNKKNIRKEFESYDLIISCGLSSAFLERAGLTSDIVIPYGSDLYAIPFREIKFSLSTSFIKSFFWKHQAIYQKKAYKKAKIIVSDDSCELYKKGLDVLNITAFNIGMPMLYNKESYINQANEYLWHFLNHYDFVVFNHSRQYWCSNEDNLADFQNFGGIKRNDKLIKAFASFIKKTRYKAPILVLFEYGIDADESKKLVEKLGIISYVTFMPLMNRKNIMYGLTKACMSSNAFRNNISSFGGTSYESLAAGVPHLNNCINDIADPKHKFYNAPMLHALSEQDILNVFIEYENAPDKFKDISKKSIEWFDQNLGEGLAKKYVELFKALSENKSENISQDIERIFGL